ncbi:VCBS repeat-containing protein [Larkinella insperata]|uniref:VCBS repeat-containing protein n=1 Tax=Larkinella insperata TaxID=332158 RepID=A0ABW3QAB9_9BACT|nr:VCBS repeat-containing protein [Larkinella insperata]
MHQFLLKYLFLLTIGVLAGCQSKRDAPSEGALFELLPAEQTGIHFANTLKEDERLNILTFEYFYNGGGVGLGDINNDGLTDVFLGGNMTPSRLYLNKGNFKFEDITEKAGIHTEDGWATGISMVDLNADGLLDIYVCRSGPHGPEHRANQLYINQGNLTFREEANSYRLDDTGFSTQAAFFDYDRDGDLDVYILTNVMGKTGPNVIRPKLTDGSAPSTDRLYRNDGNGHFANVSEAANIKLEGYGLGISIVDVNADGWPDVYVANDYLSNDILYINQAKGSGERYFTNQITEYFKHQSYSAMGTDAADIDNDGLTDFITLDMLPEGNERRRNMFGLMNYDRYLSELRAGYEPQFMRNTLQHNNGFTPGANHPTFSEIGRLAGVQATDWSWCPLLADYDNDGFRDLMITNGYPKDITNRDFVVYRMAQFQLQQQAGAVDGRTFTEALHDVDGAHVPNYLFRNNGGSLTFTNQSAPWGFDTPSYSNGAAYADLDNDGDLDLVINNLNQQAFVYRNRANDLTKNHYLRIRLKGNSNNRYGFGAKVAVYYGKQQQFLEHSPYRGYQSTVENTLHFGLGKVSQVDSIRVTWLDGKSQLLTQIKANQVLIIDQRAAVAEKLPVQEPPMPLFREVSESLGIRYKHTEELYIDFKIQPLLPHLLSQNGPGLAVGDMNGDGREDFFVGGAFNHSGMLFFAEADGKFRSRALTEGKKYEEDLGALLFDADGDGDGDLYVVSGSSEFAPDSPYYQDRLYRNDGKGHFSPDPEALPRMLSSGSTVQTADFDRDGDLDLFVGGRLAPGKYPLPTQSYVLRNDGGRFTDVTQAVCPQLTKLGMVTSALWTDFDGDGWPDLIALGEWMPLTFFKNNRGQLVDVTQSTGLTHTHGWWSSLVAGDFDGDGDPDYVAGNLGLNNDWRTSPEKPVTVFAGDFDKNGTVDPVISQYIGDELYPVHPKDEMTGQMNYLRKKFPRYADYAKAKLTDVFTKEELSTAYVARSETFQSVYLENRGNGKFVLRPLPTLAQQAPLNGLLARDFDGDGKLDLLISGNFYGTEAITGRYDASIGLLLKGHGNGNFTPIPARESGFWVGGDARGLAEVILPDGRRLVLAAQNDGPLKAFVWPNRTSGKK